MDDASKLSAERRNIARLAALGDVAAAHDANLAEVSLAWLIARKGVIAPIASANDASHVTSFAKAATLHLSEGEVARLDRAAG